MKKIVYKSVVALVALLSMVGCETIVEFRGEYVESQPVLNAVVSPDGPVRASYSRSVFILADKSTTPITDGTVELFIDDEFVERLTLTSEMTEWGETIYRYEGTVRPSAGDKVTIRARSDEFPQWTSGTTTIPYQPNVGKLSISESNSSEEEGYDVMTIRMELSDPEGVADYYFVRGMAIQGDNPYANPGFFDYTDIAFREGRTEGLLDELLGGFGDHAIFADAIIDGEQNYPLTMECEIYYSGESYTYQVECRQIDEHLYKYWRSMNLADNATLFGEPVQIHTNVEGGLGIVGAQSASVVRQKKRTPPMVNNTRAL